MLAVRLTTRIRLGQLMLACAATMALMGGVAGDAQAAGSPVSSFGSAGVVSLGAGTRLFGTTVQSNGDVVAVGESGAGTNTSLLLARFTASGALDSSFGSGGMVRGPAVSGAPGSLGRAVAIQSDGKIVVVGEGSDASGSAPKGLLIERYSSSGALDTSFGSGGVVNEFGSTSGAGYAVAIQSDGKIVATGSDNAAGSGGVTPRVAVVRLNPAGSLDSSFAGGGLDVIDDGSFSVALATALQSDGKIVIAGSQSPGGQVTNALLARLTSSGAPDSSFKVTANQYAKSAAFSAFNGVAVQSNGAIVAAGTAADGNSGADAFVVRFTSAGVQDSSFGTGGVTYTPSAVNFTQGENQTIPGANAVVVASNGEIVAGGTFANGIATSGALFAFTPGGASDSSFGTGGTVKLTGSQGNNTEFAGLAVSPTTGNLLAAGDSAPLGGSFTGIEAQFTGFGAPTVNPPPPPPPPPPGGKPLIKPFRLFVNGVKRSYTHKDVGRHGLKLKVSCNKACKVGIRVYVSAGTARRLNLYTTYKKCTKRHGRRHCVKARRYRALRLSPRSATFRKARGQYFVLRLNGAFGRALNRQKRNVGIQLIVTARALSISHGFKENKKHITVRR